MTLVVVGVSHRSAPFDVLDRLATDESGAQRLVTESLASDHVAEAMVLATCNRVEVYADVDRFHGAVEDLGQVLSKASGVPMVELGAHLYVHYDARAVHHLMSVSAGLDSMVIGEQQILGQVRQAHKDARDNGALGRELHALTQAALRVGKRVHSETAIDHHGASVVSVGLDEAAVALGTLHEVDAVVVGAGAMSALAVNYLRRAGVRSITVVNRTKANADALTDDIAADGLTDFRTADLSELPAAIAAADVVVACTGSSDVVINAEHVLPGRRRVFVDLALPHDIATAVGEVPGCSLITLASLATTVSSHSDAETEAAAIVDEEARRFVAERAAVTVQPLVVSLRAQADGILEREVQRLRLRLPEMGDREAAEVERAMRRALSALLHNPTVKIKQLAADPEGERLAAAVRALFDLDPESVQVISGLEGAGG